MNDGLLKWADLDPEARNAAFDEIEQVANKAASYSRSISEAAYRGDDVEMLVHMKQLKACLVAMITVYKDFFDDAGTVGTTEPKRSHRQDHRSRDGVA